MEFLFSVHEHEKCDNFAAIPGRFEIFVSDRATKVCLKLAAPKNGAPLKRQSYGNRLKLDVKLQAFILLPREQLNKRVGRFLTFFKFK